MNPIMLQVLAVVAALGVGIGIGWLLRGALKEELVEDTSVKKRWYRRLNGSEILGITVATLAVVGLVMLMVSISEQRKVTECQSTFNKATNTAIMMRTRASELDRQILKQGAEATVTMLDAILNTSSSQETRLLAIQTWRAAQVTISNKLNEGEQIRQDNPLPMTLC